MWVNRVEIREAKDNESSTVILNLMTGIEKRIDDASFLWKHDRRESAFLLVLIAVASVSKLRYPNLKDGEAFRAVLKDFKSSGVRGVEYRGKLEPIEQIFYRWVRCQLVHEGELPVDLKFQEDEKGSMSVGAGGAPEFVLKLGTGWFFHFAKSVLESKEVKAAT